LGLLFSDSRRGMQQHTVLQRAAAIDLQSILGKPEGALPRPEPPGHEAEALGTPRTQTGYSWRPLCKGPPSIFGDLALCQCANSTGIVPKKPQKYLVITLSNYILTTLGRFMRRFICRFRFMCHHGCPWKIRFIGPHFLSMGSHE
jgi:hypothetical protein